jgi:hypothetical protein
MTAASIDLCRELLLQARVLLPPPPLVRRPLFWLGIGAAAAIAAGVTAFLLYDPPERTVVRF